MSGSLPPRSYGTGTLNLFENMVGVSGIDKWPVWKKGEIVKFAGHPAEAQSWRRDDYGKWIKWSEYGRDTQYGWCIDHIIPLNKGGSDALSNLRPLHWRNKASGSGKIRNQMKG